MVAGTVMRQPAGAADVTSSIADMRWFLFIVLCSGSRYSCRFTQKIRFVKLDFRSRFGIRGVKLFGSFCRRSVRKNRYRIDNSASIGNLLHAEMKPARKAGFSPSLAKVSGMP